MPEETKPSIHTTFGQIKIGHLFEARIVSTAGASNWLCKKISSQQARTIYGSELYTFKPEDKVRRAIGD